jgi:hypothetical protein
MKRLMLTLVLVAGCKTVLPPELQAKVDADLRACERHDGEACAAAAQHESIAAWRAGRSDHDPRYRRSVDLMEQSCDDGWAPGCEWAAQWARLGMGEPVGSELKYARLMERAHQLGCCGDRK